MVVVGVMQSHFASNNLRLFGEAEREAEYLFGNTACGGEDLFLRAARRLWSGRRGDVHGDGGSVRSWLRLLMRTREEAPSPSPQWVRLLGGQRGVF